MTKERLGTEFGSFTDWMVEAIRALRIEDAIPAACRGTGNPALLKDLADAIEARSEMLVLDAGSGMGGPAAWLRRERGCVTVGVDLMEQNVRAGRELFAEPFSLVGAADAMPFRDATFDAVWAVGVVEMIDDKPAALAEAARVLKRGGRMAVYSFTSRELDLPDRPESDTFASPESLSTFMEGAGMRVLDARPAPLTSPLSPEWRAVRLSVFEEVRARHGDEEEYEKVRAELERFNRLRASGLIEPWRYNLVKDPR